MAKISGKVRIAILGLGNMGSVHATSLYGGKIDNSVLAAVCDINPDKRKWAEEKLPGTKIFNDLTSLIESGEADALLIATPHYNHMDSARQALEAGMHVLTEKPAGVYTKQVKELNDYYINNCASKGLVFAIMFQQRTNPAFIKMHDMIKNGELGKIRRSVWVVTDWYRNQAYYSSGDWRATWRGEGGGVLLNQCPHNLDLWQWICGMPDEITAFCGEGKWHDIEVEDDVTAYVKYPSGGTGVFITSTGDCPGSNRFEVTGDNGKLVYENNKLIFTKLAISEQEFSQTSKTPFDAPEMTTTELDVSGDFPQHNGVIKTFADKLLNGGELVANGIEGINGLTLSNAMHLSSWLGKTITLPIDEDLFYSELQKKIAGSDK